MTLQLPIEWSCHGCLPLEQGREGPEFGDRGVAGKCVHHQVEALIAIQVPLFQLGGQLCRPCCFEQHGNSLLRWKVHLKKMESFRPQDRHGPAALTGLPALVLGNEPAVLLRSSILKLWRPAAWDGARVTGCGKRVGIPHRSMTGPHFAQMAVRFSSSISERIWTVAYGFTSVRASHLAHQRTGMGGAPVHHPAF